MNIWKGTEHFITYHGSCTVCKSCSNTFELVFVPIVRANA